MKLQFAKIESLNEISYILKAIYGSFISNTTLNVELASYYCHQGGGLFSIITRCDGLLMQILRLDIIHDIITWKENHAWRFVPYKNSLACCMYDAMWFDSLFKGEKICSLRKKKLHWNFIQASTRMVVESVLSILQGRWRILLKRINVLLQPILDIATFISSLHVHHTW